MMVVLGVFMEWCEAARGQTRTTETVVFGTSSWKMCQGREKIKESYKKAALVHKAAALKCR